MQARRILLIFAIVLLLSAAAASVVPVPEQAERGTTRDSAEPAEPPPPGPEDVTDVTFDARSKPRTETVQTAEHVVVTVRAGEPGQVRIDGLGRFGDVAPLVAARFDLFTDREGRFDVVYTPVEGEPRTVGTLVVGPDSMAAEAAEAQPEPGERSSSRR